MKLNNNSTTIFLSVGGNDIIQMRNKNIEFIFKKYIVLIEAITEKLPNVNLVLCNLYYPPHENKYDDLIDKWNTNIELTK